MKLNVPVYRVDFRHEPEKRWDHLLTDRWACRKARLLCRAMERQVEDQISLKILPSLIARAAGSLAKRTLGDLDYLKDMEMWSEYTVGSLDDVILGNFAYELHQTGRGFQRLRRSVSYAANAVSQSLGRIKKSIGLCTSVAFHRPELGMVHCRNLDWPLAQIREATIILDCKSDAGPFRAVSVPGMVGVLSGVAKRRFSITINSKEDSDHLFFYPAGWSAALLARWVLENCGTYDEALRELKRASAFLPFFATLVGTKRGQAAIIEVNSTVRNRVYPGQNGCVAVSNHFPSDIWEGDHCCSAERQESVETDAAQCRAKSLVACFSAVSDVIYADTVQSMVMHPRSGELLLQMV